MPLFILNKTLLCVNLKKKTHQVIHEDVHNPIIFVRSIDSKSNVSRVFIELLNFKIFLFLITCTGDKTHEKTRSY